MADEPPNNCTNCGLQFSYDLQTHEIIGKQGKVVIQFAGKSRTANGLCGYCVRDVTEAVTLALKERR